MENVENEFISIVIPAYNTAELLPRCLDSVLTACDPDCEVIVVDDASTDDTAAVAERYQLKDPRVYLVRHDKHEGVGYARQTGVETAQGDSVMFVDSDDVLPPEAIAELRRLSGPDIDIVAGNMTIVNLNGTRTRTLSGGQQTLSGTEYAEHVMLTDEDFRLVGKKYRRSLFDRYFWDVSPIYGGMYHRIRMLSLACAARKAVIAPAAHVYTCYLRPFTLSSLIMVRPDSVTRLWQAAVTLPVSRKALTYWGLRIINQCLIERGIPFDNEFMPAVELRNLCLTEKIEDPHLAMVARLLESEKARLNHSRRLVREGKLTVQAPQLSFVIVARRDVRAVEKTVKSIMDTGMRNIQIVIVDTCIDPDVSVELHRIAVFNPRVTLEKHPPYRGTATARITGFKAVKGLALMLVQPGDTIETAGVLEALNQIDSGSEIAFMGCRYTRLRGLAGDVFDPSKCLPIHQGAPAAYGSLAAVGDMMPAIYGLIYDRRYILKNKDHMRSVEDDLNYKTLVLMHALSINPRISATGVVGYVRNAVGTDKSVPHRVSRFYAIGHGIIRHMRRIGLADPGHLRSTAMGLTQYVHRTLARQLAVPFIGRLRLRKTVRALLNDPDVIRFYQDADMEPPTEQELIVKATASFGRHRWPLRLAWLFRE